MIYRLRRLLPYQGAILSDNEIWEIIKANSRLFKGREREAACMADIIVLAKQKEEKRKHHG